MSERVSSYPESPAEADGDDIIKDGTQGRKTLGFCQVGEAFASTIRRQAELKGEKC
jgi:hypothetical protein